jgi:hypothetical protein
MSTRWIKNTCVGLFIALSSTAIAQKSKTPTTPTTPTQAPAVAATSALVLPFGPGERLEYNLYALGTNAGRLKIGVVDQGEYDQKFLMSLAAKLEPAGLVKIMWQGESRRTSFLDTSTLLPLRVIDIEETPEKIWKTQLDFDGLGGVTSTRVGVKSDGSDVISKRQVPLNVAETLSGLYQLRLQKFLVGDKFSRELLDNGRIYKLDFVVDRKEKIKTILGEEETIVLKVEARRAVAAKPPSIKVRPKMGKSNAAAISQDLSVKTPSTPASQPASQPVEAPIPPEINASIWFSIGGDQIPLRFEVEMYKVGSMTAELTKYTPAE